MSSHERNRQSRRVKTLCGACQERKARFRYRGEIRADRYHTLCFECFRAAINRARARRLSEPATLPVMQSPFAFQNAAGARFLDARQRAHRQRMLDHLQHTSSMAS